MGNVEFFIREIGWEDCSDKLQQLCGELSVVLVGVGSCLTRCPPLNSLRCCLLCKFAKRHLRGKEGTRRGKLMNLNLDVGTQPVAWVIDADARSRGESQYSGAALPTGSDRTLKPNIEVVLLSKKGKVLQDLLSRSQENYIQLKTFRCTISQQF